MKIYLLTLLVPVFALANSSWATSVSSELRVRTTFADRDVRFLAKKQSAGTTIEMLVDGKLRSRKLKDKEWKFLLTEFSKLPMAKALPPDCDRARMDIVLVEGKSEETKASCFGVKSITSEKYVMFAQFLMQAFPD